MLLLLYVIKIKCHQGYISLMTNIHTNIESAVQSLGFRCVGV